jgi:hypothetical protein
MGGAVPPLPNTPSWRGAQGEHRDEPDGTKILPRPSHIGEDNIKIYLKQVVRL